MVRIKRRLPLYASLGALFVYVVTLGQGVTVTGLPLAAKVAGWDWQPMASQPLLWLVTSPFRLLPASWVPIGLNLLSAACAATILGLLARSVELLLPRRGSEKTVAAGGPGLRKEVLFGISLACVVCGLEFSYWQAATGALLGELLDLLLLASAIWMLLEYRLGKEELRSILAAAFVWGLGMAENWVMLFTFPLFMGTLVVLRREEFFRPGFLVCVLGLGVAGGLVYALLPLVNWLGPGSPWGFGEAWRQSLLATKVTVWTLFRQFGVIHPLVSVLVVFYFLVPIAPCLIRQRERGYVWFSRSLNGLLFLACLWLALDPVSGPRQTVFGQTRLSLSLLSFDYVNALGAGYLAGYFLQVARTGPRQFGKRNLSWKLQHWLGRATAPMLSAVLVLMAAALILRNGPAIWRATSHPLAGFGELAAQDLPADGGGVVLSDDTGRLLAFQAALSRHQERRRWLPVDTQSLPDPKYRRWLERTRPSGWLSDATHHTLGPIESSALLRQVARTNQLLYLHPSYGEFFEFFYQQPRGVLYEMKPYPPDRLAREPLSTQAVARAEKVWDEAWQTKIQMISRLDGQFSGMVEKWSQKLALHAPPSSQSHLLAEWYSVALNAWGVELQRDGHLPEARHRFEQALTVNSDNFAASFNLRCNTNLQAGSRMDLAEARPASRLVGDARRMTTLMKRTGPFDAPVFCYLLGCAWHELGQARQAMQQFERARALAPDTLAPGFSLVQLYSEAQMHDKVFETTAWLRKATQNTPLAGTTDAEASVFEAQSWFAKTDRTKARAVLESLLKKYPDDLRIRDLVGRTFLTAGDYTNALQINTEQLAADPANVSTLINQAAILLLLSHPSNAIPVLDRALALTNSPKARLNRALAYLQTGNLDAAEADYLEMTNLDVGTQVETAAYQVNHGLADIAARRHDTNRAIHHLELCLSNAPAGSALWREAQMLLQSFKPPAAKN